MEGLQTLTFFVESKFDTPDLEKYDTRKKNEKIIGLMKAQVYSTGASSESQEWEELGDFATVHYYGGLWREPRSHGWKVHTDELLGTLAVLNAREVIETYKAENLIINLDINSLYVKEYTPFDSIKLFEEIVGIGNQIFKDARSSSILEEKAIDCYFRSKTRTIRHKEL